MLSISIINVLNNKPNQLTKFRSKNWVEINETGGRHNTNSQIKLKTSMLKSNFYDYNDAHKLVSGTIAVPNTIEKI